MSQVPTDPNRRIALVVDLIPNEQAAFELAYDRLSKAAPDIKIMLATYFGALGDNLGTTLSLPIAGLHIDLARAPEQLDELDLTDPNQRSLLVSSRFRRNTVC